MQEPNVKTQNASKKKCGNIKITKKIPQKVKDSNNLITSYNYNNGNINNSFLLNKVNIKFDKKTNLRNISQSNLSTKCLKTKEKESFKLNQKTKSKNKYSITRDKDRGNNNKKNDKFNKSKKKYTNTKDILLNKNHSKDINNHSFNHFKKIQNSNSNNRLKNIDDIYYSNINIKNNKIPRFKKYEKNKKNIILPFFFHSKKSEIKCNYKRKKIRSKVSDYNNILKNLNISSNIDIAIKLLSLPERSWMDELKENINLIEKHFEKNKSVTSNSDNNIIHINTNNTTSYSNNLINEFIKGRIIIQENFNWLLWAMGIWYVQNLQKNEKNNINNNNGDKNNINNINNLNIGNNIEKWKEGFVYNGVYFILLDKVEKYEKIKIIKREIKSLNLLFLDYIQLLDNISPNLNFSNDNNNNSSKISLIYNILFPLISLLELTDCYILASLALEPSFEKSKIKSYCLNEEEYINSNNYYNDIDISNFNVDIFKQSPLFYNISENNLLNLNNGKYYLININKDLHPLMISESIDNKDNIYLKYSLINNFIGKGQQIFNKAFLGYFEYFINYLQNNKYILDIDNLEYEMNKFGINKCFYLFILSKIKLNNSCDFDTSNNICSLIKIYILVKLLTKINDIQFSNKKNKLNINNNSNNNANINNNYTNDENKSETSAGTSYKITKKYNSRTNIKYSTSSSSDHKLDLNSNIINTVSNISNTHNKIKNLDNNSNNNNTNKRGIKFISQLMLAILNPKSSLIEINNDDLIYKLLYQSHIYLDKFKKLNSKLFSCDVSDLYEPRSFLKSLITSARKNPFIFLKQIESKFNVIFDYEIKYRTSICLENFMKYFKEENIKEKEPKIISYINADEIGFYLIINNIYNNIVNSQNNNNNRNNFKKKGNKVIYNMSSENIEFFSERLNNYDNFSILNRSINKGNSNFHILNSSKEKAKIHQFNKIPLNTEFNNASNKLKERNINLGLKISKNNIDTYFSGSNFTTSLNNILSESTNNNEEKKNDENTNLDIYEFGDDESDKSLNFSNEESSLPRNFNKKRNTANINNSKFNLNSTNNSNNNNKNNGNNNTGKTLNTLNYNTNTTHITSSSNNNLLNNFENNEKNFINKKIQSNSSELMNKSDKNNSYYWHSLFNNFHLKFPYNLYKVSTHNYKSNLPIYKSLSMYYTFFSFLSYSKDNYTFLKNQIPKNCNNQQDVPTVSQLLTKTKNLLENIFDDIISINPNSTYILIHFYIYYFLNFYFVDIDKNKSCEEILTKINNINTKNILYKKTNFQIIITLLNGLLYGKDNFLKVEEFFAKSLILSLVEYGEPRGRNNDGRSIMMYPVWKTGRNFLIMDNNEIINDNYKEMFKALMYCNDNKTRDKKNLNSILNEMKDLKDIKLYDKNIMNDLYRDIKYDLKNYKKNKKISINNNLRVNNIPTNNRINTNANNPFTHFESKSSGENCIKKKNITSYIQNNILTQNEDFFNFNDEELVERLSKCNLYDDTNLKNNEENINGLNNNRGIKKNSIFDNNNNCVDINNKFLYRINHEANMKIYFKENLYFPEIKFPPMSDKKSSSANSYIFFTSEKFFIYFIKSIFSLINFSVNESSFTEEYMKNNIFEENNTINSTNNSNNNSSSKQKKQKPKLENILNDNLYYKKYNQSNILISFGNNSHCETGHAEYKSISTPRVLYQLKNKDITLIKSGWEHNICQDKNKMLYGWGNNSRYQCGFESTENTNGNITYPKNILELNDKNIIEVSCGNEHTLALTEEGVVYSWGSTSDGVLGRESRGEDWGVGVGKPGIIPFFLKNDIKIRHISSGSIHNLCLDNKSNLYSWGCSKGGQLGFDEKELNVIYKQNNENYNQNSKTKNKSKSEIENDNNFCLKEPKLIKSLKDIDIIKISSGEAHNAALSIDGKCYVWGLGSNGQLGLGFCEDFFKCGEGLQKSRIFTPTVVKEFDKNNNIISKVFCGKTFTIFLNKNEELYSTGINDLNQCGIDNKLVENNYLCNDIITPIKIEMFIRMKIISVSCGESHVLAITEDNGIRMLFSWGSNRFGQLGQSISTKKSLPKIVNYFLHYNNSDVSKVSCGAFHSMVLLKIKEEKKYNKEHDEKYIFGIIDKYEDYSFENEI